MHTRTRVIVRVLYGTCTRVQFDNQPDYSNIAWLAPVLCGYAVHGVHRIYA